ncbi:MAG: short-chain dehydrogenase [Candidatus Riflebacteria bacterium]|nr:short-chain dehydrogenase [Candidatus Riflebacteria bacterium]
MEIKGNRVLVLGGWGEVGSAICREFMEQQPAKIVVCSLLQWQADDAVRQLRLEFPGSATELVPEWGDVQARHEFKDLPHAELLADPEKRRTLIADLFEDLSTEGLHASFLYRVLERHRPHVVVDCINLATIVAYQDVWKTGREVMRKIDESDGPAGCAELKRTAELHLANSYIPKLIRHVQVLYNAMLDVGTRFYVKIGTSGTGGMGLNIPYTHSEEKPSRVLLSKSAMAGAHTLLLFLMARTPNGPMIKEVKPTAAIAWKGIQFGPVMKRGKPAQLYPLEMGDAVELGETFTPEAPPALQQRLATLQPKPLESVFIDTGENGVFSLGEFEAISSIGQMECVTPEEIAHNVIFEIKGGNTGHDVINALDQACMGPTYRAGTLREAALEAMRRLEKEHGIDSVAFENLGPPKLSKVLFEAYLLKRTLGTMQAVIAAPAEELQRRVVELLETDDDLRSRIVSIGIPILLADGRRLLRTHEVKIPASDRQQQLTLAKLDQWATDGWVDLRLQNFEHWRERFAEILRQVEAIPFNDTSSRYEYNKDYWFRDPTIQPGKVASWLFINEEKGLRMKA